MYAGGQDIIIRKYFLHIIKFYRWGNEADIASSSCAYNESWAKWKLEFRFSVSKSLTIGHTGFPATVLPTFLSSLIYKIILLPWQVGLQRQAYSSQNRCHRTGKGAEKNNQNYQGVGVAILWKIAKAFITCKTKKTR